MSDKSFKASLVGPRGSLFFILGVVLLARAFRSVPFQPVCKADRRLVKRNTLRVTIKITFNAFYLKLFKIYMTQHII